jgi:glutamine cyclotransferase
LKINYFGILRPAIIGSLAWSAAAAVPAQTTTLPVYAFVVKHSYPHDPQAFTQGLFFKDGHLFEGTGMKGQSSIRKVAGRPARCCRSATSPRSFSAKASRRLATISSA